MFPPAAPATKHTLSCRANQSEKIERTVKTIRCQQSVLIPVMYSKVGGQAVEIDGRFNGLRCVT